MSRPSKMWIYDECCRWFAYFCMSLIELFYINVHRNVFILSISNSAVPIIFH